MSSHVGKTRWIPLLTLAPVLLIGCSSSKPSAHQAPSLPPIDTAAPASPTPGSSGVPSAPTDTPSSSPSAGATSTSSSPSTSASASPSATSPASATASSTAGTGGGRCATSQLALSLGQSGGAAGSSITPLIFTNTSSTGCTLAGFPGVSFVTGSAGTQVGEGAARSGSAHGTLTLAAGRSVQALFQQANAENYPPGHCKETSVVGLRVYPPDQTAALYVPLPTGTTACSTQTQGSGQNQSSVQAVTTAG